MEKEKEKLEVNKKFKEKHTQLVAGETLESKNETRGITLIALVITIIVLLILAAVSIATLTGDNGILTKAKIAETTNNKAQAEEEMKLLVADWQLEKRSNSSADLGDFLNEKLENGELDKVTDNKDGSYKIERNGYKGTINEDGELEGEIIASDKVEDPPPPPAGGLQPGKTAETTQKANYTDENDDKATVPEGFKVSEEPDEQSIDTGLVVIAPDGSEFVWVPVQKAIATTSPTEPAKDTTEKAMAVKVSEDDYRGLLYDFKGTGVDSYSELITGCTTITSSNREPAYLTDTSYGDESSYNPLSKDVFSETTLKAEYKAMVESVEEYEGFYVGRYETSINGSTVASKRGETPMTAETTSGNKWWGMYEKQKNYVKDVNGKDISKIVSSSMIWGSQYDAIMNWMLTSETEKSKVTASSTKYEGNTGNPNDVMNKIYDLGSNLFEWTLETGGSGNRVVRGSCYVNTYSPSLRKNNVLNYSQGYAGSRLTLYIN